MSKNSNQGSFDLEAATTAPLEGVKYSGRHVRHEGRVYFPVVDVIAALTDSPDPSDYWYRMQARETTQLSTICRELKVPAANGKSYKMHCVDIEGALRLVQSIPSPKAEPIKRMLAKIAYERLEEEANPELGITRSRNRAINSWRRKGHSDDWIAERLKTVDNRNSLTSIWQNAGVSDPKEFARRTAIGHSATFGLPPKQHKALKSLRPKDKLREHMVTSELSFTSLGEIALADLLKSGASLDEAQQKHAKLMSRLRSVMEEELGTPIARPETPFSEKQVRGSKQ